MKPKFSTGDLVRPLPGCYEGYTAGSKYNLPRGTAIVVESNHGYIKVCTLGGGISPAVNPDSFEFAVPLHDGPVRIVTTTRKVIEPGVYGRIGVGGEADGGVRIGIVGHMACGYPIFTSAELTAAIATLTTIRDALDEVA